MFCPFTKGSCNPECIFNNGCFDEDDADNCNLVDAIRNIQSDGFVDRTPKDYLESIETTLKSIQSNTGSDQTDSWEINSKLNDVVRSLDEIKKKL